MFAQRCSLFAHSKALGTTISQGRRHSVSAEPKIEKHTAVKKGVVEI